MLNVVNRALICAFIWGALHLASSQIPEKLTGGLEFRIPEGWDRKLVGENAVVSPPDAKLMADKTPAELYFVVTLPGVKDLKDPQLASFLEGRYLPAGQAKLLGSPKKFRASGGSGALYSFQFQDKGVVGQLDFYAVELARGGVAAVIAAGTPELVTSRSREVAALAASLSFPSGQLLPPGQTSIEEKSALVQQWYQRLRGKKMVQMSSYSSGSSGGSNSRRTLALAADGTFTYQSSSSVSIYVDGANGGSSGQKSEAGRWRLYEQAGNIILEMKSIQGEISTGVLRMDGTKTLLNNVRWFVVGINE